MNLNPRVFVHGNSEFVDSEFQILDLVHPSHLEQRNITNGTSNCGLRRQAPTRMGMDRSAFALVAGMGSADSEATGT